ncbi:hypothetical protein ACI65C_013719 [Semiaphis heraclei]
MSSYSVVHFLNDNSVEAVPSTWIKAGKKPGVNLCAIKHALSRSLTNARDIADDARYRSDFTNTDEDDLLNISNIINSPTSSTSSMPIYDDEKANDGTRSLNDQHLLPLKDSPKYLMKHTKSKLVPGWSPNKPLSTNKELESIKEDDFFFFVIPSTIKLLAYNLD